MLEIIQLNYFSESSWISWPLAFLFNNTTDDGNKNDVTLRFRHLDVKMGSSRRNSASGGNSSPSPESENGIKDSRSPKRSPLMIRKRETSPNMSSNGKNHKGKS